MARDVLRVDMKVLRLEARIEKAIPKNQLKATVRLPRH